MPVARTKLEIKLLSALRRIAKYESADRIRRDPENDYCLTFEEAIEMAYENVQEEAKTAIKGVRVASTK